ncbi:MAG: diguanylate cyclase [Proteobacteria bacterium]|nr:diguanylate cyclase [Pseudomonadota bacterium]
MASKTFTVAWSRWCPYLSIGTKTLLAFSLIITVLAGGFYYYIDTTFSSHARNKAEAELATKVRGAAAIYSARMEQMKFGMLQAGSMESVQRAVLKRDSRFLTDTLRSFAAMRPYVDFWAVVDSEGTIIASRDGSTPSAEGYFNSETVFSGGTGALRVGVSDSLEINGIVERALGTSEVVLSTEVVPSGLFGSRQEAAFVGDSLAGTALSGLAERQTELLQVVITPVKTAQGVAGAFVTGILLDGYGWLTDSVEESFAVGSALFDFSDGPARLLASSEELRSLLSDPSGSLLPLEAELKSQYGFLGTASAAADLFVAVEPLLDSKERVVGGIAVAIPSREVFGSVADLKGNLTALVLFSVLFSMGLAWLTYRDTTRPIGALVSAMEATAEGETDVRVDIRTKDEFERIGVGFNTMVDSIEIRETKLNHFVEFVRILINNSEPAVLLKDSLEKIVEMTGSSAGVVYVKDARTGAMWPAESVGMAEGELETFICNESLADRNDESYNSAVYVNKVDETVLLQAGFTGCIPEGFEYFMMCNNGALSGVFMVGRGAGSYTEDELAHIDHLITQFAISLDNSYTHKEVERLSITDPLTGLFNRRHFYERFKLEFTSANRYNYNMAVLMIDIDDFKSINDTYGHQVGDKVLKRVSEVLQDRTRTTDTWARYGGEEFIGFVSHCNVDGTLVLAEKIRSGIEQCDFAELGDRKVTVSIGMGLYPCAMVQNHDEIVKAADEQLYRAKGSGKNRVSVSDEQIEAMKNLKTG